jgi:L-histidine N-alpha-methyltransferase
MTDHISTEILFNPASDAKQELGLSVLEGLSKRPKNLPSHLFYNDKGSDLFTKIMSLKEYYPTRCEAEILKSQKNEILSYFPQGFFNLIELGCGDGQKTLILLEELLKKKREFQFVPLDISQAAVETLISNLKKKLKKIEFSIQGLVAEYFQGLSWLNQQESKKNVVLFMGSNIGNFQKFTAMRFLRNLWLSLNAGDLVMIGFDLKKDLDTLYDAYNDKKGITKEFNLNVLDRMNEQLGANFDRSKFQHQGLYNVQTGAMESYLMSLEQQEVFIKDLGKSFSFDPWEPIHMEYSYKYLTKDIEELAESTGFEIVKHFKDSKGYFIDSLWRVIKD